MSLIQKLLSAVGATAMIVFSSGASAVPFSITAAQFVPGAGYGIDVDESSGTLLDVRFSTAAFAPQSFSLNAIGQSATFSFGIIDLEETNAFGGILPAELDGLGITAKLTFTAPTGVIQTIVASGIATFGTVGDSNVDYVIDWSPITLLFGNGGSFQLSLSDLSFDDIGSQTQFATITLLSASGPDPGPASVPEPGSSITLLGIGIGCIAIARRARTTA